MGRDFPRPDPVAATERTLANRELPSADDPVVQYMVAVEHRSLDDARHAGMVQGFAASLEPTWMAMFGERYGGAYLRDDGKIAVQVTGLTEADTARLMDYARSVEIASDVLLEGVLRSRRELLELADEVAAEVGAAPGHFSWSVGPTVANQVAVRLPPQQARLAHRLSAKFENRGLTVQLTSSGPIWAWFATHEKRNAPPSAQRPSEAATSAPTRRLGSDLVQRWGDPREIPAGWGRCVATVGVFDGMHRGHQQIVHRTREVAAERGLPAVLVSFTPHPSEVVRPGSHPAQLTTNTRKAELAQQLGLDALLLLPFTLEFSRLPAADFVHQTLVESLHAAAVVVGANFRFGHGASGDFATLTELGQRWGFDAETAPLLGDSQPISSTYIRSCVQAGDVPAAAQALGRPHRLDGVVVRGDQRGRDLGYPTANLRAIAHSAVPADGIYAGRVVHLDEWGNTRPDVEPRVAAISVGTNPTFDGRHRSVEAFVLDFSGDLYGQNLGVEFHRRLRGMERYDNVQALIAQMDVDVQQTRAAFAP